MIFFQIRGIFHCSSCTVLQVMHVVPTFHLPMGINMISQDLLRIHTDYDRQLVQYSGSNDVDGSKVKLPRNPRCIQTALQTTQLSFGQYLGGGVVVLGHPHGWTGISATDNECESGLFTTAVAGSDDGSLTRSKCCLFVWIDPYQHCLPDGAEVVPFSDDVVSRHFIEYEGFESDHLAHFLSQKNAAANRRRHRPSIGSDNAAFTGDCSNQHQLGDVEHKLASAEEAEMLAADRGATRIRITDVVKFIELKERIPAPRDRFRERRAEASNSDSEDEEDHLTIHPRVTLMAPEANAVASIDSTSKEPTSPTAIPSEGTVGDRSGDAEAVAQHNSVERNDATGAREGDDSVAEKLALTVSFAMPSTDESASSDAKGSTGGKTEQGIGFESPPRPHIRLRMGFAMGAMTVEGGKPPDVPTLLQCLDAAQEEIDQLENENISYRFKTTTALRDIEYLKTKLDRMTANQRSRQEEFQAVRDNITELKGTIAHLNKTIELRDMDTTMMRKRYEEKIDRLKVGRSG
jgi:hypothetical protein